MAIDIKILEKLYPLDTLLEAHLKLLAEEGDLRDLKRDDIVFEEGGNDGESVFLISGRLVGSYSDGRVREIDAESKNTRYAVGDLQPRRFTAKVQTGVARVVAFNRGFLEKVLTWDQISRNPQFALGSTSDCAQWVFRMLKTKALLRLPAGNVQRMFERFEEVRVMPLQDVVSEGDEGDYFYVIKEGKFEVVKDEGGEQKVVATLDRGDSFGEDALISEEKRNATVRATSAGALMRLSKRDFGELLRHPVVDWVTPGQASALMSRGAGLLDVRMKEEHGQRSIKGSENKPLFRLREEMGGMTDEVPYVVYCDTGERSASAAFILNKLGYEAFAIRGGMSSVTQLMTMAD
jgi:CRP-like cAMP-binding protein